jgi:Protein of unknown function, DUF547
MPRRPTAPIPLALAALCLAASWLIASPASAADPDGWDALLAAHARDGGLDYAGLAADRGRLDAVLSAVAAAAPSSWGAARRLAFWINAYNAAVVGLVVERYPGIASVRDVEGFFDALRVPVAGRPMTLDEIESQARAAGDPRVHFALVCASASCPDLRPEAYLDARLDEQLEDQVRRFLADPAKGLRFDAGSGELYLSSIFQWYAGDFTGGSTVVAYFARSKVAAWVAEHVPDELAQRLRSVAPEVHYMDYDWSLNDR